MTDKKYMTLAEAIYLEMVERDKENPDWDYPLRLDSARRALVNGSPVEGLVELLRVRAEDLVSVSTDRLPG